MHTSPGIPTLVSNRNFVASERPENPKFAVLKLVQDEQVYIIYEYYMTTILTLNVEVEQIYHPD